jgi:tRNA-Thr(GGU) m(6)t(6)A37 methyltransferase TsaA
MAAKGVEGTVEVFPEYVRGLSDLEGFSHIVLVFHFHMMRGFDLMVTPYMDQVEHGVFATRAPGRPNPIGVSIVELVRIEDNRLIVQDVDIVDKTPLLDIKPHVPEFDKRDSWRIGWLKGKVGDLPSKRDDGRFLG